MTIESRTLKTLKTAENDRAQCDSELRPNGVSALSALNRPTPELAVADAAKFKWHQRRESINQSKFGLSLSTTVKFHSIHTRESRPLRSATKTAPNKPIIFIGFERQI